MPFHEDVLGSVDIVACSFELGGSCGADPSSHYGRSPAVIMGLNPTRGIDVCCECCVLSGRGLCDGLITRP